MSRSNRSQRALDLAVEIFEILRKYEQRIVFAESCTAGLLSATFGRISGVSEILCGSAVTYRIATKADWLNIPETYLVGDQFKPVTADVARQMAQQVLRNTTEAHWSVSVTGFIEHADPELDGLCFSGICQRNNLLEDSQTDQGQLIVNRYRLDEAIPATNSDTRVRQGRQDELVIWIFTDLLATLRRLEPSQSLGRPGQSSAS